MYWDWVGFCIPAEIAVVPCLSEYLMLGKEFTLSSPNTQNRTTSLTETEQNQMESKTITKLLNKTYLIENANQNEPSNQKKSKSNQRSTSKNRTKSKIESFPGKMKQSENYKNITESTPLHLDRMETQDTIPTNHNKSTNQTSLTKHLPYKELQWHQNKLTKQIKSYSGTFQVRIGTTLSELQEQEMRVSQGSILSVTLFNIKINNIVKCLNLGVKGSLYVDDFLICCKSKYI